MKTIHKFEVNRNAHPLIEFPGEFFKPLSVQMQNGKIFLWAIVSGVDEAEGVSTRKVSVYGTGWDISDTDSKEHVGTIQDGLYVWHIFISRPLGV